MLKKNLLILEAAACVLMLLLYGCDTEDIFGKSAPVPSDGVSNGLHLAFKTPDWERNIDCTHLDLPSFSLTDNTYYTFASSASTRNTFYFSFPQDSSDMVKTENLKKYTIAEYGQNSEAFQFSFKVPVNSESSNYLYSQAGLSDESYNEVVAITYAGKEGDEALFRVKCRYKLQASEANSTDIKPISGSFHFKLRTTRN